MVWQPGGEHPLRIIHDLLGSFSGGYRKALKSDRQGNLLRDSDIWLSPSCKTQWVYYIQIVGLMSNETVQSPHQVVSTKGCRQESNQACSVLSHWLCCINWSPVPDLILASCSTRRCHTALDDALKQEQRF